MTQKTERRYYFRINDIIGLAYTVLDASEEFSPGNSEGMEIQLANVLTEIDTEFSRAVNTVWQQNPAIAQALGLLNRKISIMAAHYPQGEGPPVDSHKELLVESAGGVSPPAALRTRREPLDSPGSHHSNQSLQRKAPVRKE